MSTDDPPTWRYVFAKEIVEDEQHWTIRELYEGDGGISWTGPITPHGDSWYDMHETLIRMGDGAGRLILDLTLPEPKLRRFSARTDRRTS